MSNHDVGCAARDDVNIDSDAPCNCSLSKAVEAPGKAREWTLANDRMIHSTLKYLTVKDGPELDPDVEIRVREVVGNPTEGTDLPSLSRYAKRLEREVSRLREGLESLLHGCGNHACRVQKPIGQGTNGPCMCAMNLTGKIAKILGAGDDPEKGRAQP